MSRQDCSKPSYKLPSKYCLDLLSIVCAFQVCLLSKRSKKRNMKKYSDHTAITQLTNKGLNKQLNKQNDMKMIRLKESGY